MRSPLQEVKLSYKDLVQVWHPDRFTHSPRLQEKAANKLQQLNEAYDTLKNHLERQSVQGAYGYGSASDYGTGSYSARNTYGSTGYATASQTATAAGASTTEEQRSYGSRTRPRSSRAAHHKVPSFFDSGASYSWQWQLKAAGVIFGLIGLMLLPVGLTVLIAQHPLLSLLFMPLPLAAYLYRIWVNR